MAKYKKNRTRSVITASQKKNERQLVLKVFRNRLKSPGTKSMPIHDNKAQSTKETRKLIHTEDDSSVVWMVGSSTDSEEKDKNMKKNHKIKRWKTKSERDKVRALSIKPCKNEQPMVRDTKERSDFRKHLRMAHETALLSLQNPNPARSSKIITQNRLTKRLGLFNQGKASETIGRESLAVPESVQAQTELHIRDILGSSTSATKSNKIKAMAPESSTSFQHPKREHPRILSSPAQINTTSTCGTRHCSPAKIDTDGRPADSPKSACSSPDDLPDSPDIGAIAADLLGSLQKHSLFERDLLKEAQSELRRLLRLSCQDSLVTPYYRTPTQRCARIALPGSASSENVTRSKHECSQIGLSLKHNSTCINAAVGHQRGIGSSLTRSREAKPEQTVSSRKAEARELPACGSLPDTASLLWILQDDGQTSDLTQELSSQHSLTDLEVQALTDARALFTLNDILSSQDASQQADTGTEQGARHGIVPDFMSASAPNSHVLQCDHLSQTDYPSSSTIFDFHEKSDAVYGSSESKNTATGMICPLDLASSHQSDVHDLSKSQHKAFQTPYQLPQFGEDMDVCGIFDADGLPHSSKYTLAAAGAQMEGTEHGEVMRSSGFLQPSSPCGSASPAWYPTDIPLPPNPCHSPSPTMKLYPRRLY